MTTKVTYSRFDWLVPVAALALVAWMLFRIARGHREPLD
jgi:hypothetical protein